MHIARVIGTVVSARKDERLDGSKLLLLEPLSAAKGKPSGDASVIAIDTVGAGVDETVLYVTGSGARRAVGSETTPTDAAVVGIVDHWDAGDRRYHGA